jgi:prevent-host-death family protein
MGLDTQQTYSISEFRKHCQSVVEYVNKTGNPVVITKRNASVAVLSPLPKNPLEQSSSFGCLASTFTIPGDIIHMPEEQWDVENDA